MLHLCHFLNHVSFIEEEGEEEEGERDEQEDGAVIGQVGERDEQERDEQVAYTVVSLPCGRAGDVGRPARRGARSRACSRLVLVLDASARLCHFSTTCGVARTAPHTEYTVGYPVAGPAV